MLGLKIDLLLALVIPLASAVCPSPDSLPVLMDDYTFLCARTYLGPGGQTPEQVRHWHDCYSFVLQSCV